ncbi:unnamed protein product [Somion occarium]|uniref:Uncharacterized protein n=1 Tax=Somion occarium TaxID=3059160 RepID=A0ABP1D7A6_9APHY
MLILFDSIWGSSLIVTFSVIGLRLHLRDGECHRAVVNQKQLDLSSSCVCESTTLYWVILRRTNVLLIFVIVKPLHHDDLLKDDTFVRECLEHNHYCSLEMDMSRAQALQQLRRFRERKS